LQNLSQPEYSQIQIRLVCRKKNGVQTCIRQSGIGDKGTLSCPTGRAAGGGQLIYKPTLDRRQTVRQCGAGDDRPTGDQRVVRDYRKGRPL
jgi:hypothetical protein